MRRYNLLCLLFGLALHLFAVGPSSVLVLQGHVMDSATGEALPYATLYVNADNGTLTNADGDFILRAAANDTIYIRCMGYEQLRIEAKEMPTMVRLKPLETQLDEVTVLPLSAILDRAQRQLKQSLSNGRLHRNQFFCRIVEKLGGLTSMVEAIVDARSMVHLRDMAVLGGRQTGVETSNGHTPTLKSMNMHHLLEVGPMMRYNEFWQDLLVLPLNDKKFNERYNLSAVCQKDKDGRLIYVINMKDASRPSNPRMVEGTAYIDAQSQRLVRFVGTIPTMLMMYKTGSTGQTTNVNTTVTIDYTYTPDGMAEVSNISFETRGQNIRANGLMYRISGVEQYAGKRQRIGENMIADITEAGFDSLMWARSGIVKRTAQEESLGARTSGSSVEQKLKRADWLTGQEKVFLHMDNTAYEIGDTLRFSAYTRDTRTHQPSNISGVLYVELLRPDGFLVERKMVELQDGHGMGFFVLRGENMRSGFCELRAYTRWQLNWGAWEREHTHEESLWFANKEKEQAYFRDYEKLYSRVFPVFEKVKPVSSTAGNHSRSLVLTFYPEGGQLLAGAENHVAFEAARDDGEAVEGRLVVNGDTVRIEHRGRGSFVITPEEGRRYEAELITENGETIRGVLPKGVSDGATLHVVQLDSAYNITSHITPTLLTRRLAMIIRHEGILEEYIPFDNNMDSQDTFCYRFIPKMNGVGIYQATIIDEAGSVYADRLFFVKNGLSPKGLVLVEGLPQDGMTSGKVQAKVKLANSLPGKTHLSIAIRSTAASAETYDKCNILSELLLASELRDFIPDASWYFQGDDYEHRRALDLLLLTQKWSRFDSHEMLLEAPRRMQPSEDSPIVRGQALLTDSGSVKVSRWESKKMQGYYADMKREAYIHAMIEDTEGKTSLPHIQTNDGGHFSFSVPKFSGSVLLHIGASPVDPIQLVSHKWQVMRDTDLVIGKRWANAPLMHVSIDNPFPRYARKYSFYQCHLPHSLFTFTPDSVHTYVMEGMDVENAVIDAGLVDAPDPIAASCMNVACTSAERKDYLAGAIQRFIFRTTYSPRSEKSVPSEVEITAEPYPNGARRMVFSDRCFLFQGFADKDSPSLPVQTMSDSKNDYEQKNRCRTLYWNPNLQLDENGEAIISFYHNNQIESLSVEVEGQAQDGTLLWGDKINWEPMRDDGER